MTLSNPNYLPKAPSPNIVTLEVGLQRMNGGGGHESIAQCKVHGRSGPLFRVCVYVCVCVHSLKRFLTAIR